MVEVSHWHPFCLADPSGNCSDNLHLILSPLLSKICSELKPPDYLNTLSLAYLFVMRNLYICVHLLCLRITTAWYSRSSGDLSLDAHKEIVATTKEMSFHAT